MLVLLEALIISRIVHRPLPIKRNPKLTLPLLKPRKDSPSISRQLSLNTKLRARKASNLRILFFYIEMRLRLRSKQ